MVSTVGRQNGPFAGNDRVQGGGCDGAWPAVPSELSVILIK